MENNRSWQQSQSADGEGFTKQSDRTSQSTLDNRRGSVAVRFLDQISSVLLTCGRGRSLYLVSWATPDTMARLPLSIQAIESSCCLTVADQKKRRAWVNSHLFLSLFWNHQSLSLFYNHITASLSCKRYHFCTTRGMGRWLLPGNGVNIRFYSILFRVLGGGEKKSGLFGLVTACKHSVLVRTKRVG